MVESAVSSWPAVTYEDRRWVTSFARGEVSGRQWIQMQQPYAAAVTPEVADRKVSINSQLLADAEEASVLLSRFDSRAGATVLPFESILLRSESASSSQIENLTSSARAVAEAELGERDHGNAALIVRNVRALSAALELADELSDETIVAMQAALLAESAPEKTGEYRVEQVWIGGNAVSPHRADFIPPVAERVPSAMHDLLGFARRTDVPVIAHVAIAHAQFETIHPFLDGNGRTGRALVQSLLRRRGTTLNVAVPVSAGLLHDLDAYFAALTAYRAGDIEPIVTVFVDAAGEAVRNGNLLFDDIRTIREEYDAALSGLRSDAAARRVAGVAFEHPVVNVVLLQQHLGIADQTAYRAIDTLVERGILTPARPGRRNRSWAASDITDALDRFAARAGRREGVRAGR
ncbi:Fic family protein [Humibacter ginsenosidimutans]|uniref:Fic family protein n=1 Tax=Humibacter ginsenosidimutans TaxID=2599293 RepID=UPI001FEDF694|nr:Fic family protein [Humibacter ginsenosidimutans]